MSASLVGSEMCIRDRHGSGYATDMWLERLAPGGRNISVAHLAGRRPCSVSYTHLTLPTICSV
eukprot:10938858-Alexandrium_andersonii.AAC.1